MDKIEFKSAVRALYDLHGMESNKNSKNDPAKKSKKLFKLIDVNKDQKIQKDEFIDACLRDQNLMNFLIPFWLKHKTRLISLIFY